MLDIFAAPVELNDNYAHSLTEQAVTSVSLSGLTSA
jgi:hypothetical protein